MQRQDECVLKKKEEKEKDNNRKEGAPSNFKPDLGLGELGDLVSGTKKVQQQNRMSSTYNKCIRGWVLGCS